MVELRTARLLLRELAPGDAPALHAIECLADVVRYMTHEPQSLADAEEYIARVTAMHAASPRELYEFAVIPAGESTLIGRCGLRITDAAAEQAMIWYVLSPSHQGRGYMSEAAIALMDFAFGGLGMHRVYADIDPRNERSKKLAERLGMRFEAHMRENVVIKGERCDTCIFAMLKREWLARR